MTRRWLQLLVLQLLVLHALHRVGVRANRTDKDEPVVRFKGRHGIVKAKGAVEVQARAGERPDLPLLILLGWYLILLHADDAAAATSASSVAVISST